MKSNYSKSAFIFVISSFILSIILWGVLFQISEKYIRFESFRENIDFAVVIYVFLIEAITLHLGNKLINKICLPLLFIHFILNVVISKVYYNYFFIPYDNTLYTYNSNMGLLKILPITLTLYVILRKVFMYLTGEEPKIVGKSAFFSDFCNYLFTILVLLGGIALTFIIPFY